MVPLPPQIAALALGGKDGRTPELVTEVSLLEIVAKICRKPVMRTTLHAGVSAETAMSDGALVETEFMGYDDGSGEGPFVTWVVFLEFRGLLHDSRKRYATWDEAVKGHEQMVKQCKQVLAENWHGDVEIDAAAFNVSAMAKSTRGGE
jgi:hypothetical protein